MSSRAFMRLLTIALTLTAMLSAPASGWADDNDKKREAKRHVETTQQNDDDDDIVVTIRTATGGSIVLNPTLHNNIQAVEAAPTGQGVATEQSCGQWESVINSLLNKAKDQLDAGNPAASIGTGFQVEAAIGEAEDSGCYVVY